MNEGFPGGASGRTCLPICRSYKRYRFNPWVGKIPLEKERKPTPVLLPGESHRKRILAGYRPQGCKESDTTEVT